MLTMSSVPNGFHTNYIWSPHTLSFLDVTGAPKGNRLFRIACVRNGKFRVIPTEVQR